MDKLRVTMFKYSNNIDFVYRVRENVLRDEHDRKDIVRASARYRIYVRQVNKSYFRNKL